MAHTSFVIGIDEVGRGSLAGPVTVAAVCLPKDLKIRNRELGALKDSKQLSSSKREEWLEFFKNHPKIKYALARVYPKKIEKINISKAANLAALRAYRRLVSSIPPSPRLGRASKCQVSSVYLDGGLYLGNGKSRIPAKTIIKGDEKIRAIQVASILAKVSRDRALTRLAKKYPDYGFEIHKGYGTKIHLAALKRFGPTEIHRLTFLRSIQNY